jgi:hypothetical protein
MPRDGEEVIDFLPHLLGHHVPHSLGVDMSDMSPTSTSDSNRTYLMWLKQSCLPPKNGNGKFIPPKKNMVIFLGDCFFIIVPTSFHVI